MTRDRGSTMPLVLGFTLVGLVTAAGAVSAGQAFVHQRELQDRCDELAAAAAAESGDIDRGAAISLDSLHFVDVQSVVNARLRREPTGLHVLARVTDAEHTVRLRCTVTTPVVFGALFGKGDGVRHVVESSAQEPLS